MGLLLWRAVEIMSLRTFRLPPSSCPGGVALGPPTT